MRYVVVAFYKFTPFHDCAAMKDPLLSMMHRHNIKGTIILASEGINGSFCAEEQDSLCLIAHLRTYPGLKKLDFQKSYSGFNPFDKAKVKLRQEIVSFGQEEVDPLTLGGESLHPLAWNQLLLSEKELLLIDTRNDYEFRLGSFKGATNPKTAHFRDFPDFVSTVLEGQQHKKIAMFCTGGIRCEKSTAYLKKNGFKTVYQLKGGILNYLQSVEPSESLWKGSCFVFDNRVALDQQLNPLQPGTIDIEWKNKILAENHVL